MLARWEDSVWWGLPPFIVVMSTYYIECSNAKDDKSTLIECLKRIYSKLDRRLQGSADQEYDGYFQATEYSKA